MVQQKPHSTQILNTLILVTSAWHQEGFWFCFLVVLRFFQENNPALGSGPYCREGTTGNFSFAAEVNSSEKPLPKPFASSRVFLKGWMLSNYHQQPPNAVCKQINNPMSTSEPADRLHSKTLQFSEELRLQVLYKPSGV